MKLSESVTYPSLEGVPLCRTMQPAYAQWLWWEKRAQVPWVPGVRWQPPPWWEAGLEMEGLEPEPGATLCVREMAVSTLVWDAAGAQGFGAALLCWFYIFPTVHPRLEAGSGPEGLVPHC